MLGSIAAIFVVVWFYLTARKNGRQPVSWGFAGLIMYFITALIWTYFVTPPIKDAASHSQNGLLIFIVRYAYILVGVASAVIFNLLMPAVRKND